MPSDAALTHSEQTAEVERSSRSRPIKIIKREIILALSWNPVLPILGGGLQKFQIEKPACWETVAGVCA